MGHNTKALWILIPVTFTFLQVSVGETQKPIQIIERKQDHVVEMDNDNDNDDTEDPLTGNNIGVINFSYFIMGVPLFIKYHFDPKLGYIQTEVYFGAWVKNMN